MVPGSGFKVQPSRRPKKMAGQIEKETEEWIRILKKLIGQDQPDRQDTAAFAKGLLAAGEKILSILSILSKK